MKKKPTPGEQEIWLLLLSGKKKSVQTFTLPVLSGSMYPGLKPGDKLLISTVDWRQCHRGDIIVFREENHLVAHRLLFRYNIKDKVLLYQKGDKNPCGTFISPDRIVGKALAVITTGESSYRYFNQPQQQRVKASIELAKDFYYRLKRLIRFLRW